MSSLLTFNKQEAHERQEEGPEGKGHETHDGDRAHAKHDQCEECDKRVFLGIDFRLFPFFTQVEKAWQTTDKVHEPSPALFHKVHDMFRTHGTRVMTLTVIHTLGVVGAHWYPQITSGELEKTLVSGDLYWHSFSNADIDILTMLQCLYRKDSV